MAKIKKFLASLCACCSCFVAAISLSGCSIGSILGASEVSEGSAPEEVTIRAVYAEAKELGYDGTLEQFLQLCKGRDGVGISEVYLLDGELIVVLDNGEQINVGNVQGVDGVDGKSAYDIWLENGNVGTEEDFLNSLKGQNGTQGVQGEMGSDGKDGEDGKSAYEIWLENGNSGTEEDFLQWLKGKDGEQGSQGEDGKDGKDGENGVGIENIELDEKGSLIVTLTDGTVKDLGCVVNETAFISEIRITEGKTLLVTLGNGMVLESAPLDVTFEGYVNGLSIDEKGEVFIYTSIGVTQSLGIIEKAYINEVAEIVVRFKDGTEMSFGTISGIVTSSCVHEYGEWSVGIVPTCTSIGYNVAVCALCGDEKFEFVEKLGHDYGDTYVIKEADGEENGVQITACRVCGNTKMEFIDGYSKGLSYEKTEADEYRVTGLGTCKDENIIVPDRHEGLPVTEIGEKAFYDCDGIVSVSLPDSIKKIHDKAFSECENLAEVSMSDKVEIGLDVFRGSIKVEIIVKHMLTFVEAKEASCTEDGNIAYYWCETCDMYYEDADGTMRIYEIIIPRSHEFVDGVCKKCGKVQDEILIVAIDEIEHLGKFSLGTLENAIGLPEKVTVYTADGFSHQLAVVWDLSDYNKSEEGEYTIKGIIQSGEFHYIEGLTNQIEAKVEIVGYMEGTADIVFVLDISGSMGDEITNVKENIIAFAQAIEDQGVSARWSAITYSDFTVSGSNEVSQIIYNGASEWYTTASDYQTAIGGISLAYGGDSPETAIDGLMLANTLTKRKDARVFYILLTDDTCKVNNNYGVSDMSEAADILAEDGVNVSVITKTYCYDDYETLTSATGGIMSNIYDDFSQDLIDELVPIIYDEVVE